MGLGLIHREIYCNYKSILWKILTSCFTGTKKYSELNMRKEAIENEFSSDNTNLIELTSLLKSDNSINKRDSNYFITC